MPLQWLPLQQRQQQPQHSAVSQALTPRKQGGVGGTMPKTKGFMEEQRELEAKEAERKYNEKMMKMQHEQEMEKLKFAAGAKEDAQKQQTTMGNVVAQAQQQGAQKQQIEDNPEPSAKAMYDLIKSMPLDTQNVLLNQLFTPTAPAGGITSAGRGVTMPEKYNPIASVFLSKGWATIDKGGRPVLSDPEREFEKGTYEEDSEGNIINTATGETIIRKGDIPKNITTEQMMEVAKEARAYTTGLVKPGYFEGLDAAGREAYLVDADKQYKKQVAYLLAFTYGVPTKEATRMANNLPKQDLTPPPEGTVPPPEGGEIDEGVVTALKLLLEANPDEINNIEQYKEEYGEANVNKAWGIPTPTTTPTTTVPTTETAPLTTSPSAFKGKSPSAFNKEKYGKYKQL